MIKSIKNLSKTTKVVAVTSIAGAAVIGGAVGAGLAISNLNKDTSDKSTMYDEFTKKLATSNSPFYLSWEAAGRSMLSALKKGTTRAVEDSQDYVLAGMLKRSVFKDSDSQIKYEYIDPDTKQRITIVADLNVTDSTGAKKANIILCKVNGQEITKTEIENVNEILDRETAVTQDKDARREANIQRLQEIAVDEKHEYYPTVKPKFSKSTTFFLNEQFHRYKINPFDLPDDVDGFTFSVVDVLNPLSSGYIDVIIEIKLKTDEGQPLSRRMVRHVKTVSDAESIDKDGGDYLDNFISGVQSWDIDFDDDFWSKYEKTLPSKIPFDDIKNHAVFLLPPLGYIQGKIVKFNSANDDKGSINVDVEYSYVDKDYSKQIGLCSVEIETFERKVPKTDREWFTEKTHMTNIECDEFDQEKIMMELFGMSQGDDILQELKAQSDRNDNGSDANTFFNYFPIETSKEITKDHSEELTNEILSKFGFPPSITLNTNQFKYTYWMDEVTDTTDHINFHVKVTPLGANYVQLSEEKDFVILVDNEGMATYKQYIKDQESMATAQGLANSLIHSNQFKFVVDSSMDLSKLLPEDTTNPLNSAYQITEMEIPLNDDLSQWAFLKNVDPRATKSFRDLLFEQMRAANIDPSLFQYRILLQNFISVDGAYKIKFVADYKGNKFIAQPNGDKWIHSHPEPIEVQFEGLDKVLIERAHKFLQDEIANIKNDPSNNMPSRYFSHAEINSAAFKDPSSVYFGYTFNPNSIIVPGIKDAELTPAVIAAFNTRVITLNDPNISYTYSHGQIAANGTYQYVITLTRGAQTKQISVPVEVNGFLETKTNVKEFQLEQFDKEVIKPNNMVFQLEAFDYNLPTGWFTIDRTSDSQGGSQDEVVTFVQNDANTRRLYAWLTLYKLVNKLDENQHVEAKIDPKRNADGTYNVHLRVVGHTTNKIIDAGGHLHLVEQNINWYQEGVDGEIVFKANVINREINGLENRAEAITTNLKVEVVTKTGLPPFDRIIRTADEYFNLFSSGLKLFDPNSGSSTGAAAVFEFENYYYEVKSDKPLIPSATGTQSEVQITAFLKSDPKFKVSFTNKITVFSDTFAGPSGQTSAEYAKEIQNLVNTKQAWNIGLLPGVTINSVINDNYNVALLVSSEFETEMANPIHALPGYSLHAYRQLKAVDTPNGKQFFCRYIYEPARTNTNAEKMPIFTFDVPVTVHEADNAFVDYVKNHFYGIKVVHEGVQTSDIVDNGKYIASVPLTDEVLSGDIQQLNKYLNLSKPIRPLLDGYFEARRVVVGHRYELQVSIYRDSTKAEKIFGFTIQDNISLVGASPIEISMTDASASIYN